MFSYRHAFHAGNHADVLKHLTWLALLRYAQHKPGALHLIDTHAGAGPYRLDHTHARTSAEADAGIARLLAAAQSAPAANALPALVADYVALVQQFNPPATLRIYPGSPWISQALLRPQDRLKLFEVHPTDAKVLAQQVAELGRGKQIEVLRRSGFEGLKSLLPPAGRRAVVLIDPSYEIKTDYAQVTLCLEDALKRFATGTYMVWYPVIARPEAHALARKLKTLSARVQRPWLQAELNVGLQPQVGSSAQVAQGRHHTGLRASGVHIINPPFTLADQLRQALPWVQSVLREPVGASWSVEQSAA